MKAKEEREGATETFDDHIKVLRKGEYVAILMAMAIPEHVPLAEVKNRLSEVVDRIERAHGRVIITKHGRPSVVIMSLEDLESLEETLAILSNPRVVSEIRQAEAEIAAGKSKRLSKEDAVRLARRR